MDHSIGSYSERERACLRLLAEHFELHGEWLETSAYDFKLNNATLPNHEFDALMGMMIGYGVLIDEGGGADGSRTFKVTPLAVQKLREIEMHAEIEKRDAERREVDRKARQEDRENERQWQIAQKEADRKWQEEQKDADRKWQIEQKWKDRAFAIAMALAGFILGWLFSKDKLPETAPPNPKIEKPADPAK